MFVAGKSLLKRSAMIRAASGPLFLRIFTGKGTFFLHQAGLNAIGISG
jgi:hypothetical protein